MSDYDRDPAPPRVEPAPTHERVTEHTTVVTNDRGGRGGGWIVAILVLIALLVVLFLLFGKGLNRAADEVGVNVNVEAPKIEVPDSVKIDVPDKVEVEVPDELKVESNSAN
jgi:hypothetical protein